MKIIILLLSMSFVNITVVNASDDLFFLGSPNFETNHIKSWNNNNSSSSFSLGFSQKMKERFNGMNSGISISDISFAQVGLSVNKFGDNLEYEFVGKLFCYDVFDYDFFYSDDLYYAGSKGFHGAFKLLNYENDIFKKRDIEWIKLQIGTGGYTLKENLNYEVPSIYIAAGYSDYKPEKRTSGGLNDFKDYNFSGLDVEIGANLNIEEEGFNYYNNVSYRRIIEFYPDIEIIKAGLKIGYVHYLNYIENGLDFKWYQLYRTFSVFIIGNIDWINVNSNGQVNTYFGIELSTNPYLLFKAI